MPRRTGHCILDEFQTHPPQKNSAACPPHDGPARIPSKRDEFLKRDRQLSLRTSIPGSVQARARELNPTTKVPQGPRRPRLSFFRCDCQTARSRSPTSENQTLRRPAAKARPKLEFHSPRLRVARNDRKFSTPPRSREECIRRVPVTRRPGRLKSAPRRWESAHIGPCEISVNGLSQRNFPLWNAAPRRAVLHAFSGRRAGAASRAAAA